MSATTVKGQNRQEVLFYLLGGTVVLFLLLLGSLAVWYGLPAVPSTKVTIGNVDEFPVRQTAYYVREAAVWVSNTGEEIYVFAPTAPQVNWSELWGDGCYYKWNEATGRFEDPCSGFKFGLDGFALEESYGFTRDRLDQYRYEIRADGRIIVDFDEVILGEPQAKEIGE